MTGNEVIEYTTHESREEYDGKYLEWYERTYVPILLKNPSLWRMTLYRIAFGLADPTHPGLAEAKENYAKYLTINEFKNGASLKAFLRSSWTDEAERNLRKTWNDKVTIKFREWYQLDKSWEVRKLAKVGLIHVVGVDLPSEAASALKKFHEEQTVPTLSANPNLLSVRRYEIAGKIQTTTARPASRPTGNSPKILNIYALKGIEEFRAYEHSLEMETNSKNYIKFASTWPPGTFRTVTRAQYTPLRFWTGA